MIKAGALADLLVLDGDPLSDPTILLDPGKIYLVLQHGEPIRTTTA